MIHPTAIIYPNVTIEEGVYVGAYCIIGAPPESKKFEGQGEGVIIRKGTKIHGHVCIDSGTIQPTEIGEDCYIMKHSYIAHDCKLENGVVLSAGVKLAGHVTIQQNTNLGMGACVHQWVEVPPGCMIGMNAVVTKTSELLSHGKYVGVPVKLIAWNNL